MINPSAIDLTPYQSPDFTYSSIIYRNRFLIRIQFNPDDQDFLALADCFDPADSEFWFYGSSREEAIRMAEEKIDEVKDND
jgi:hypothetical protein